MEYKNSVSVDKNENKDAGCAVYEHESASSVYVQWGRRTCTNGHETVYYGLIMDQKYTNYKSTFMCIDWTREPHPTSKDVNNGGGHLYTVEFFPGKVGEYTKGHELSCAICSDPQKPARSYTLGGGHNNAPAAQQNCTRASW